MFTKKHKTSLLIMILTMISLNLFGNPVPRETVVAEYNGGQIQSGDLDDRISQIPPMYQTKYKTEDGKKGLLDMMCTEAVFYQEAKELGIDEADDYLRRVDMQIKAIYYRIYKTNLLAENVILTEEEKMAFFREESENLYAGRIYEEVEDRIIRKLRPEKEKQFLEDYSKNIFNKYDIKLVDSVIESIDLNLLYNNKEIETQKIITSSNPEIEKDVAFLLEQYPEFPPQQKTSLMMIDNLKKMINDWALIEAFYHESLEKGYESNETVIRDVEQIKKNMMMKSAYNRLVVNAINIDDETMKRYYNDHIDDFSSKASRKIQFMAFNDEKTANDMYKKAKKLLKKNDLEALDAMAAESSLYPKNNGKPNLIYENQFIPGIGRDEIFSEKIWDKPYGKTNPAKFSKVFENSKGEFAFFRIIEDNPAEAKPFLETIDQIKSRMNKELSKQKFDEVTAQLKAKYNVVKYEDRLFVILTAEEYFNLAEEAQKKRRFEDAIYYYNKVEKYHKNNKDDYKASFMVAFIYSEELKDKEKAKELFNDFLTNYPEGELHESARFMIQEFDGEIDFESNFEN